MSTGNRPVDGDPTVAQRRRIRRSAVLLALAAIAIYVAFIASGAIKAQG